MNKIYGILNSIKNDRLTDSVQVVEDLLKSWGASVSRISNADDIQLLKRENAELKKNLKDLKQSYLTNVPNPTDSSLQSQVTLVKIRKTMGVLQWSLSSFSRKF